MNLVIKRRQVIMSALVLALGSAVFVNWQFNKPQSQPTGNSESASYSVIGDAQYVSATSENSTETTEKDPFESVRLTRKKSQDEATDKLKKVINDPNASASAVDSAAKSLAALSDTIKLEADIEALIESKCGFESLVIIVDESVEIACEKGSLDGTSIVMLKDIILKHTNIKAENITIFEVK
ncbi:MAG: SpoIIIAH-like family protein [Clostridia bacterium]|nr:SpoIIIAH-like family protein [Clostridia bacterium]